MFRKLIHALLLPVVLLLSQQGAVTHEIGHIRDFVVRAGGDLGPEGASGAGADADAFDVFDGSKTTDPQGHRLGDLQCEACLAFAQLAGVVSTQLAPPPLLSFSFHFAVATAPAFIAADAPTARSRGPPVLL